MDKNFPDVSVIITTYNVENYIERAIESALTQQGITLEVIIVDDCSSDNTWQIICNNSDSRIKRKKLESNSGPGAARNAAIAMATGKWLAILDGDDAFLPGRLLRCLALADARKADVIVDNLMVYRETEKTESLMFPEKSLDAIDKLNLPTFLLERVTGTNYVLGYLKPIINLTFLRKHNITYDTELNIGEDYIFLAELLVNGAVCIIDPAAGYQYTVRVGSISHRLSLADIERILAADKKFSRKYKLDKASRTAQRKRKNNLKKDYYFLMQVNAIKDKNIMEFFRIMFLYPTTLWSLLKLTWARTVKLFPG
jgi:succinoglycan biosynthesis protein ExoO